MGIREWLTEFKALHERARANELTETERESYIQSREELARTILATQKIGLKPGQRARDSVRVQASLQIELTISRGTPISATTLDVSTGGFATTLGYGPLLVEPAFVRLWFSGRPRPLELKAMVCGVKRLSAGHRVSFMFDDISEEARETLNFLVFDTVLASLHV